MTYGVEVTCLCVVGHGAKIPTREMSWRLRDCNLRTTGHIPELGAIDIGVEPR